MAKKKKKRPQIARFGSLPGDNDMVVTITPKKNKGEKS